MSTVSGKAVEWLIDFLEEKREEIVETWFNSLQTEDKRLFGLDVKQNGERLYALIQKTIINPLTNEEIKAFAFQMAKERADANVNIGEIIYHVNCGKSVIFHFIHRTGIPLDEVYKEIDRISSLFDRFCYYTVSIYTEMKGKELQEKVMFINQTHKDRLTLLGQMSSSFVHEFRNPLTAIMGFVKLLKEGPHNHMYLEIIDHELEQLNFRITQFLHTSKREIVEEEKEDVFVPTMVADILDFIYPLIVDVDCEMINQIESNLHISAYKNELKQVLQNILLNSIDAVKGQEKPRRISIFCGSEPEHVVLRIANNGPAIPSKTIETIFEPFFTTKEMGTGIGLYVCKKIIEKHNGTIVCESNEDWTSFTIYLPLGQ